MPFDTVGVPNTTEKPYVVFLNQLDSYQLTVDAMAQAIYHALWIKRPPRIYEISEDVQQLATTFNEKNHKLYVTSDCISSHILAEVNKILRLNIIEFKYSQMKKNP
jgi:hypothetical protein